MFESHLQIHLLGGFALSVGKRVVSENDWTRRKAKRLFQILALRPQHKIHREELAEILFANKNAAQANASLSRVLYLARRALESDLTPYAEPHFFCQQDKIIELAAPEIDLRIDAAEFKYLAEKGLRTNEVSLLEEAAALYTGDLLPDALYEKWTIEPRRRLYALYMRVLHRLAQASEMNGDNVRAHFWLDKILARETGDEAAHRAKIRLYAADNQKTAALRQYQNLKNFLEKFEVEPEAETEKLRRETLDSILNKDISVHTPTKIDLPHRQAAQAYVKGIYLLNKRTTESLFLSVDFFQRAIAFDCRMATAYIGLANAYNLLGAFFGAMPSKSAYKKGIKAIHDALRIDETLFDAHLALAYSYFADWNLKLCHAKFDECLHATQESLPLKQWYSEFLTYTGRHREALAEAENFADLAPALLPSMTSVGHAFYYAGNLEKAAAKYREVLEIEDNFAKARLFLGHTLREQGKLSEALSEFRRTFQLNPGGQEKAALAHALALSGERGKAEYLLKQMTNKYRREYVSPCHIVTVLLGLNRKDEALACLAGAAREHSATLPFLLFDPLFAPLKKQPIFQRISKNFKNGE